MRKLFALCVLASIACSVLARPEDVSYRRVITEPSFGLAKIKQMIKGLPEYDSKMPNKAYEALTLQEKFTYTMIHGEQFQQNCSGPMIFKDEDKKIFASPSGHFDGERWWSQRQYDFLSQNRAQVVDLIRKTMHEKNEVGLNLKYAIMETKATELTPDLIRLYKRNRKDHDILGVLMQLMRKSEYKPFLESSICKSLFGGELRLYVASIESTTANQNAILALAESFAKGRTK